MIDESAHTGAEEIDKHDDRETDNYPRRIIYRCVPEVDQDSGST